LKQEKLNNIPPKAPVMTTAVITLGLGDTSMADTNL